MYRIETLAHNCEQRPPDHPEIYWSRGKWVQESHVIPAVCPYCKKKLIDPTRCNAVISGPVVYHSKHLDMNVTYPGIFIARLDKRRKENKGK